MIKRTIIIGAALAVLASLCGAANRAQAQQAPKRVVSFHLCSDQLLLALADPSQIAGLSPYATNPMLSVMTEQAAPFPRLDWEAESVVNRAPDLVLVAPSHRPTHAMFDAMGIKVVEIGLISDLAMARQQARDIGQLVGHPDRGEALARALEQAEARLAAAAVKQPLTALLVLRGGYSEGPTTLAADMLSIAGLRPPLNAAGGFSGFIPMEQLLIDGPDVLVLQDPPREATDQSALFITHPALLARYGENRRINLPGRYTLCGGPSLVQGLDYLAKAITALR